MSAHSPEPNPLILDRLGEAAPKVFVQGRYMTNQAKIDLIVNLMKDTYHVTLYQLQSKSRNRDYVTPRHLCMYFIEMYELTESLKKTGELFGGRDHSTVLHAKQAVTDRADTDRRFREQLIMLQCKVESLIK